MSETLCNTPALVRLFGDEFQFVIQPGAREVGIILRGELIITHPLHAQLYPGDSLTLTLGGRSWEFRVPRWSLKLRLDPVTPAHPNQ